mmetsp:Transcript_31581/g.76263  ORF Transcript_31581/g.76263 Transcript_31581/m.76263 type:complete len:252 (-) Transcript_31581:3116-3871(-)
MSGPNKILTATCNVCVPTTLVGHSARHLLKIAVEIHASTVELVWKLNLPIPMASPHKNTTATVPLLPTKTNCLLENTVSILRKSFVPMTMIICFVQMAEPVVLIPQKDAIALQDTRDSSASTVTNRILTQAPTVPRIILKSAEMSIVSTGVNVLLPPSSSATEVSRLNRHATALTPLTESIIGPVQVANTNRPALVIAKKCFVPTKENVPPWRTTRPASVPMDGKEITAKFTFTLWKMNTQMIPHVARKCA